MKIVNLIIAEYSSIDSLIEMLPALACGASVALDESIGKSIKTLKKRGVYGGIQD